ncbi:hypothetical protein [Parasulfitobacter algicola]|uniref:Uncharacterized protein n=1 Tax=Parasulfitobacter algicola TaxID=2614809 RepID=A0ABX2IXH0_9RHOB|nr:hypothetical protein [Sulfitobacter algicola]NSX55146.1 hypothetical protein [Sulfitobacter algicola]
MRIKSILGAAAIVTGFAATSAFAECTQADIQAKAMELNTKIQEMAASDPAKMSAFATKAQEAGAKMATASNQQEVCDFYDQLLAEANS